MISCIRFQFEEDDQGDDLAESIADEFDDEDLNATELSFLNGGGKSFDEEDEDYDEFISRGPVQDLDLGSSSDEDSGSEKDSLIDDDDEDEDEDEPKVTAKNIESLSRKLDKRAAREAELDLLENQQDDDEEDLDEDMEGGREVTIFDLPTAEEREVEKAKGQAVDPREVDKRIKDCVRVLTDFKRLAAKGRCVSLCTYQRLGRVKPIRLHSL